MLTCCVCDKYRHKHKIRNERRKEMEKIYIEATAAQNK